MDIQGSIVGTAIVGILVTMGWLAFWFLSEKAVITRTSQGHLYPPVVFGLRPGGKGISEFNLRLNGALMGLAILVIYMLACMFGYFWWSGLASYGFLLMSWADLQYRRITKRRFHKTFVAFAVAFLPAAVAWGLAWASFCEWLAFPPIIFHALNAITVVLFARVAVVRIPDQSGNAGH